ncbi:MAG TPA: hypothetical protein PK119_01960 [Candidatus Paceibacterota bacterium]|nr:hypothetical protein [Candidatus Paceibacterota bacterium]
MKKYLIPVIIVVVVVVIGVIFGLNVSKKGGQETVPAITPSTEETGGAGTEGSVTSEPTGTGDIGKMNDDIFIEIMAHTTYYSSTNPAAWVAKEKELFAKYGVTPEQVQAYSEMLQEDPQHLQEVAQKYMQRARELAP